MSVRARILVQVTIYRRLLIGRDGHLDQSEAYDIVVTRIPYHTIRCEPACVVRHIILTGLNVIDKYETLPWPMDDRSYIASYMK